MTSSEVRKMLEKMYEGVSGFSMEERGHDGKMLRNRRSLVYGELTPAGVEKLAHALQLTKDDVFYDLGSGVGKLVLQIAMTIPVRKCVGIEIAKPRHAGAAEALVKAKKMKLIVAKQCLFTNNSFMEEDISDATAIYTASTCFSDPFMIKLAKKVAAGKKDLRFVTLRDFSKPPKGFELIKPIKLRATWSRSIDAYVYRVTQDRSMQTRN